MNIRPLAAGVMLAVTLAVSGCATVRDTFGPGWAERQDTNPDIKFHLAEGAWHTLNAIDMAQTIQLSKNPDCYREVGFPTRQLVGEHPNKNEVIITSLLYSLGYRWISSYLERKDHEQGQEDDGWRSIRAAWHIGGIGIKAFVVGRNAARGLTIQSSKGC